MSEKINLSIKGSYNFNKTHIKDGDYIVKNDATLNNTKSMTETLLKLVKEAQKKSNEFITNEMDKEKNKDAPPLKKQKLDEK